MLIAISESRRPRRNSVRYPVNAGLLLSIASIARARNALTFALTVGCKDRDSADITQLF